jgi:preprotein translocase subunit SecY
MMPSVISRVQYAKKIQGRKTMGGNSTNIPLKVNTAGVMPIIFAASIMEFPVIISTLVGYKGTGWWAEALKYLSSSYWCKPAQLKYSLGLVAYVAMLVFFAYFYTSITFNPLEIADNLKKQGGFIPGIRPGKPTSDYLTAVLNYIIFIGAVGLTIVGVLPFHLQRRFQCGHLIRRHEPDHRSECRSGNDQAGRIDDAGKKLQGIPE